MACQEISTIVNFADLLVWPTSCNYYFWLLLLEVVFLILSWSSYKALEERVGNAGILSSLGIASLVIAFIATIGTFIVSSTNVAMIQTDILLIILAQTILFISIWIFNKGK